jgi:outer membrane protein TolC
MQAASEAVSARREERAATFGLYYPQFDASARYTKMNAPLVMDLSPIRDVILQLNPNVPPALVPPFVETIQKEKFWLADVTLTWPVFTGGKIDAANRAAEARVKDAVQEGKATEEELTVELASRYFGLRLALRVRDVRKQVLDALDTHLYQARRLEDEGVIARAERLHAEVARAEGQRELKRSEHDVALARTALANTLATSDETLDPASPLFLLKGVEPLDNFVCRAQAGNPLLGRVAAQQELASDSLRSEHARFFPDVYLFGRQELHKADLTILDPEWAIGVGAKITLFDGFERAHRVAAAKDRQKQLGYVEQKARRDVGTLVEERFRELQKAKDQFDSLEATVALADESLRVRTRAFEEGLATSLEVVDARLALSKVELERLAAAYEFDVDLAELLSACGETLRFEEYRTRADVEVER